MIYLNIMQVARLLLEQFKGLIKESGVVTQNSAVPPSSKEQCSIFQLFVLVKQQTKLETITNEHCGNQSRAQCKVIIRHSFIR